jgi:oxalate decarboxylase
MTIAISDSERSAMHGMAFAIVATVIAGFLDAVGFTYLSGLYISFMSGNSTGLAVALAQGRDHFVVAAAAVIGSFVAGAFIGSALKIWNVMSGAACVMLVQLLMLLLSMALVDRAEPSVSLLPVCLAMGMQNAVTRSVAGVETGRSFVTGALFGIGHSLALATRSAIHLKQAMVHATTWLALICGAFTGSVTLTHYGLMTSLQICALAIFVTAILEWWGRQRVAV